MAQPDTGRPQPCGNSDNRAALAFEKWQALGNDFVLIDCGGTATAQGAAVEHRLRHALRGPGSGAHADLEDTGDADGDAGRGEGVMERQESIAQRVVVRLCDRHRGVGADGVVFFSVQEEEDQAVVDMFFRNPDGSEGVCGNAMRCVVKRCYLRVCEGLAAAGGGEGGDASRDVLWRCRLRIECDGLRERVRDACVVRGETDREVHVRVGMGQPILRPEDVPTTLRPSQGGGSDELSVSVKGVPLRLPVDDGKGEKEEELVVTCVSMGNPHCVTFLPPPETDGEDEHEDEGKDQGRHRVLSTYPVRTIGPRVEHHPAFPRRVNAGFGQILRDGRHMRLRVWERAAGETEACGTGACAAVVAATLNGLLKSDQPDPEADRGKDDTEPTAETRVDLPGGSLFISWAPGREVTMRGDAQFVFTGVINIEDDLNHA